MQWLAVRYKTEDTLFLQSRDERNTSNNVLMDIGKIIETIVVKKFRTKEQAESYIQNINQVNSVLCHITS